MKGPTDFMDNPLTKSIGSRSMDTPKWIVGTTTTKMSICGYLSVVPVLCRPTIHLSPIQYEGEPYSIAWLFPVGY